MTPVFLLFNPHDVLVLFDDTFNWLVTLSYETKTIKDIAKFIILPHGIGFRTGLVAQTHVFKDSAA